uniref:Uncharacterized protein n=1 Tax=Cupriavidus taiwanensis TaxID=164546 RepID=A0A375HCX4_9BURK|nr:protein of unknown function [Cupriavidus taiwanensis]
MSFPKNVPSLRTIDRAITRSPTSKLGSNAISTVSFLSELHKTCFGPDIAFPRGQFLN